VEVSLGCFGREGHAQAQLPLFLVELVRPVPRFWAVGFGAAPPVRGPLVARPGLAAPLLGAHFLAAAPHVANPLGARGAPPPASQLPLHHLVAEAAALGREAGQKEELK